MPFSPTTSSYAGPNGIRLVRHAVAAMLCVAMLAAGCAAGDPAEPAASESAGSDEVAAPVELSAKLVRSRRDEANKRLRIEVTNQGEQPVPIDEIKLVAAPYPPEAAEINTRRPLMPGQTTAYRVAHGEPECAGIDPTPGPVQVQVTSGDEQVTLDPGDSADLIDRMLSVDCARQRILEVVSIRFDTEWDVHSNGNEQVGTLLIERRDGGPPVTLTGVRNSINYTLEMLDPDDRPTLEAGEKTLAVPVRSRGARCDGHAMGDNSKPFGFSALLSLDGGPETLVEFTADEQPQNFLRLCS
ncbi:MAG TPA: hypothetical protein VFZ63_07455 [Jiangellaceae bacterium]